MIIMAVAIGSVIMICLCIVILFCISRHLSNHEEIIRRQISDQIANAQAQNNAQMNKPKLDSTISLTANGAKKYQDFSAIVSGAEDDEVEVQAGFQAHDSPAFGVAHDEYVSNEIMMEVLRLRTVISVHSDDEQSDADKEEDIDAEKMDELESPVMIGANSIPVRSE